MSGRTPPDPARAAREMEILGKFQQLLTENGWTEAQVLAVLLRQPQIRRRTLLRAGLIASAGFATGVSVMSYLAHREYIGLCEEVADHDTQTTNRVPLAFAATKISNRNRDVAFSSENGRLSGWLFSPARERKGRVALPEHAKPERGRSQGIILVHADDSDRTSGSLWRVARYMLEQGLWVLMFDMSGHGLSAGNRTTFGNKERLDIQAAFSFMIASGFNPRDLVGLGNSAGAVALLLARTGMPLILDSAYADLRSVLIRRLRKYGIQPGGFPDPVTDILSAARRFGVDPDLKPLEFIPNDVPVTLIHGTADDTVPIVHALNNLNARHPGRYLPPDQWGVNVADPVLLWELGDEMPAAGWAASRAGGNTFNITRMTDSSHNRLLLVGRGAGHVGVIDLDFDAYIRTVWTAVASGLDRTPRSIVRLGATAPDVMTL